ncbi:MAG TPA: cytochrome C oxidase Cbb3 [Cytophagales bacterium]|jgi:cytochrome c oxidase cbb3-type subunit 4|nr:cytochrome C oxidase Cbb3 [Cytophagales bacterium]
MFKHYFEQIHNIEVWPIVSLVIFFLFFVGLLIHIFKIDKKFINKMENLPLEEDEVSVNES